MLHRSRALQLSCLVALLTACSETDLNLIEGRPSAGPYRMTYSLEPAQPAAGAPTVLTARIVERQSQQPVTGLQVLHERVIHNFIVNRDFSRFAHIHHEDFRALTSADLAAATFSFPYTFAESGHYRLVSEFTRRNRNWTKHFDFTVGDSPPPPTVDVDLSREKSFGEFQANLHVSPNQPAAGFETEMVLELMRGKLPVRDLKLILGSEIHVAIWRIDGEGFGHTHSYTPHMASMMSAMYDRSQDPQARAQAMTEMMVAMMDMPSELVFPGPRVPVRHVFPNPGTYVVFLQCAPAGKPQIFKFMLEVAQYHDGMDTKIQSITPPTTD